MSEKQLELYNIISKLPDSLYEKVMDYIQYLEFSIEDIGTPENLIVKSKEDLIEKLAEGIKDTDNGNMVDFDEVFDELDEILAEQEEILFPERFVAINEEKITYKGIRKLIVKNYIVFYRVNAEKTLVTIERVLYGASNCEEKL